MLHAEHDARVPFAEGRLIAGQIPGARFVPLAGSNHIILERERAWPDFLAAVRGFLDAD